jgi:hypothetical protein
MIWISRESYFSHVVFTLALDEVLKSLSAEVKQIVDFCLKKHF